MNLDRAVLVLAGTVILASVALSILHSPHWSLLTAFVGLNMLQAAFTRFCQAAMVFKALGLKSGCAFP